MLKLYSSIRSGESPIYGCSSLVSFYLQGGDLLFENLFIGDTTV